MEEVQQVLWVHKFSVNFSPVYSDLRLYPVSTLIKKGVYKESILRLPSQ